MTAHLTEEEQLETLKRWWQENGKSTVFSVVLAVAGYFGWQGWQAQQQQQAEAASVIYQDILDASAVEGASVLSDDNKATIAHLGGSLKDQYGSSLYAQQAAMILAKLAVEEGRLDDAAGELQWVLEQNPEDEIKLLVSQRLARVLLAQDKTDDALALVAERDAEKLAGFAAGFAEVRGDIQLAKGDTDKARSEYQAALVQLSAGSSRRQILEMKINDLQVATDTAAVAGE